MARLPRCGLQVDYPELPGMLARLLEPISPRFDITLLHFRWAPTRRVAAGTTWLCILASVHVYLPRMLCAGAACLQPAQRVVAAAPPRRSSQENRQPLRHGAAGPAPAPRRGG